MNSEEIIKLARNDPWEALSIAIKLRVAETMDWMVMRTRVNSDYSPASSQPERIMRPGLKWNGGGCLDLIIKYLRKNNY